LDQVSFNIFQFSFKDVLKLLTIIHKMKLGKPWARVLLATVWPCIHVLHKKLNNAHGKSDQETGDCSIFRESSPQDSQEEHGGDRRSQVRLDILEIHKQLASSKTWKTGFKQVTFML